MHYLSSLPLLGKVNPLLPSDPYLKAKHLLAGQKHAESLTPAFYRYLQAQDGDKQVQYGQYVVPSVIFSTLTDTGCERLESMLLLSKALKRKCTQKDRSFSARS
jgi:hypothetical protein